QPAIMAFGDRLLRGAVIATVTMLPMAVGSGAAFLFAINARARSANQAAPTVARAYQLTAAGNLAGGLFLALVVFPRLGFGGSQELLIGLSLLAAAIAAWRTRARRVLIATTGVLVSCLVLLPLPNAHSVLTFSPLTGSSSPDGVVFAALGTSSSVVLTELEGEWSLRTNGLAEGSIQPLGISPSRYLVTRWLGMLPFLARPEAEDVLVIGLGAGTTVESIPPTVDRVAVIEIERQVVNANRSVASQRRVDPLVDPRVELVINDARDVLNRSRRQFDVVISQPSHPWTAGAANLYTREFFVAVRARLRPRGVLAQWLGLPFVDEELLRSVLATLADVFAHVEVYRPPTGAALIFLASDDSLKLSLPEPLRGELAALGVGRLEDVAARWVLSSAGVRRAARDAQLVTDDRNVLASRSPRVLGRGLARSLGREVLAEQDPLVAAVGALDRLALVQRLFEPDRVERVANAEPDPARRQLALSFLPVPGALLDKELLLSSALEIAPRDDVLRAATLAAARASVARGDPPPAALRDLTAVESLIVAGWRAAAAADWGRLRRLDGRLAELAPSGTHYWEGLHLRAQWRARSAQGEHLRQALSLLDALLSHRSSAPALTLYAFTADRAGLPTGALAALSDLSRMPQRLRSPAGDATARKFLQGQHYPPRWARWAEEIDRRLTR
ncbi:MAG: fused MFS/spermidine synthase, partial [Acidobacteria bacterium]|nr:fused MFS/spermidine synthase [Acidobacteriota bacterium]